MEKGTSGLDGLECQFDACVRSGVVFSDFGNTILDLAGTLRRLGFEGGFGSRCGDAHGRLSQHVLVPVGLGPFNRQQ